jgi:restriction system protein
MAAQSIPPILEPILSRWPTFAALLGIYIVIRFLASPTFKGHFGEWMVNRGIRKLDPALYQHFHDLYLPRPDGQGTTQLDHVIVSPFGIFVIETKNYRGWIFGSEKQGQWTQQIYKRKARFQNPLHQNHLHVRALMDFLNLTESAFHSVVFFIGDCQFKTPMPPNVLNKGLRSWIEARRDSILSTDQVDWILETLEQHEDDTDRRAAARQHLNDLRARRPK